MPCLPASRRRANYRSKRDGLTQDERALLRVPDRYTVEEVGPGHWWAAHRDCEAVFGALEDLRVFFAVEPAPVRARSMKRR